MSTLFKKFFKGIVAAEVAGLVAVYTYYKKIENDIDYRHSLYKKDSKVLEGKFHQISYVPK